MKNLKVAELKVIAKELGIALSYTKDGKRHTLSKAELIEAIEAVQAEKAQAIEQVETVQAVQTKRTVTTNLIVVKPYKSNAVVVSGENIKLNSMSNADQTLNLNTLVKDSKRLLQLGLVDKVKAHILILNNKINRGELNL